MSSPLMQITPTATKRIPAKNDEFPKGEQFR